MAKNENAVLVEGLTKLVDGATSLIAFLQQQTTPPEGETPDVSAEVPAKEYTYEEARAVLAEKSRTGFRAEVKAILTKHGVKQLSEVTDPKVLAEMVSEAEAIGNG